MFDAVGAGGGVVGVGLLVFATVLTSTPIGGFAGEDNCPHSDYASQIVAVAERNETMTFETENGSYAVRLNSSSVFEGAPEPDRGRPFNLTGPVTVMEGQSDDGKLLFMGYVQCDFFTGQIQGPMGLYEELGERPDPGLHDPSIVETSPDLPQGCCSPEMTPGPSPKP